MENSLTMSQHTTYFSCYTPPLVGLTDQLLIFNICYKLGISLGYEYVHTPLSFPRSSNKIDSFIGINDYFTLKVGDPCFKNYEFVEINFNVIFQKQNFSTLSELQIFIKQLVSNIFSSNENKIIVRFILRHNVIRKGLFSRIYSKLNILLKKFSRLENQQPPVIKLSGWVNSQVPDQLDFRSIYFQTRKKYPRKSRFADGKVKLLVHIRQGDTAIIETPWQTFIPVWKQNKFIEISNIHHVGDKYIHVNDYFSFLSQFIAYFDYSTFSVRVSSDGYKRGFDNIYENLHRFNFTNKQLNELKQAENSYDQNKFAQFKELENCLCLVGETDENLFDLIHSSLIADIIVIGTQQRMLPKLLALYGDVDNPPILIVLHKETNPLNYYNQLGLDEKKAKIIPVKLDDMNLEDIVVKVRQELTSKMS